MANNDSQAGPTVEDRKEKADVPIELNAISAAPQDQKDQVTGGASADMTSAPNHPKHTHSEQNFQNDASSPERTIFSNVTSTSILTPPPEPPNVTHPPLIREATGPAIGPATDKSSNFQGATETEGPVLYITLLLTTGSRHPFKLDRKYLKKRNVEVEDDNPVNMSLYKLKELILRDWRDEWEAKPSSPDSIRLISMGKLLTDKSKLSDFGFKDGAAPTIVHMTIKPQEIVDEEEANKQVRDREGNERTPRCRLCLVM